MGNVLKALLTITAVAGGAAAVMAYKKRKELEDYDYEDLDDDFDDCIDDDTTPEEDLDKVEDAVEVGQTVRVKVLSVDTEHKRISLSIRQVLEDEAFEAGAEDDLELNTADEQPVASVDSEEAAPEENTEA